MKRRNQFVFSPPWMMCFYRLRRFLFVSNEKYLSNCPFFSLHHCKMLGLFVRIWLLVGLAALRSRFSHCSRSPLCDFYFRLARCKICSLFCIKGSSFSRYKNSLCAKRGRDKGLLFKGDASVMDSVVALDFISILTLCNCILIAWLYFEMIKVQDMACKI